VSSPSAQRALQALKVLAAHGPLSASQLAVQIEAPRASVYRLLQEMQAEGFVVHHADEARWGLGLASFEIGTAYLRRQPLERLARPVLLRLVAQTNNTAHLGILHGPDILYLLVERPRKPDPLVTATGVRLPAERTATGRAILAHLPSAQVRAAFSREGVPESLRELSKDRTRGWSVEDGLVSPGYGSVATAVLDADDRPVAAISVTVALESRTARQQLKELAPLVRDAAMALGARLR
jgi:DNA-binding IclR family transcriptional regulator